MHMESRVGAGGFSKKALRSNAPNPEDWGFGSTEPLTIDAADGVLLPEYEALKVARVAA